MGQREQFLEEVYPGHALRQGAAEQAAGPDHGLAIGQQHVAIEQGIAEHRVMPQRDNLGGVQHADQHRLTGFQRLAATIDRFVHAQAIDVEPE
jgi:hypothetical protein